MQDVYKTFERGTPAGNMLFKLYNGKRKMDSTLDPELLVRLQEQRRMREAIAVPKLKPIPKSKVHVNVPKPTGYCPSSDIHACGRLGPPRMGRKLQPIIQEELKVREEEIINQPVPPKRKYIGEEGKDKLAEIMLHDGKLPPMPPPRPPLTAASYRAEKARQKRESVDKLRAEFAEEQKDLEKAQAALTQYMLKPQRSNKIEGRLRGAVNESVSALRRLDQLIIDEEKLLSDI